MWSVKEVQGFGWRETLHRARVMRWLCVCVCVCVCVCQVLRKKPHMFAGASFQVFGNINQTLARARASSKFLPT